MKDELDFNDVIGVRVRNKFSGIAGYVRSTFESLTGFQWIAVQPPIKEGENTEPKLIWSDISDWELLKATRLSRPSPPDQPHQIFDLGSRLRDTVTGFTGIATGRTTHFNHCVSYDLQSEKLKKEDGSTGACESFQAPRLKPLDGTKVMKEVKPLPTGGAETSPMKGV